VSAGTEDLERGWMRWLTEKEQRRLAASSKYCHGRGLAHACCDELPGFLHSLAASREEVAALTAKHEVAIDDLRTAREALGRDDKPFLCDGIRELKQQRDALRALVAEKDKALDWSSCAYELTTSPNRCSLLTPDRRCVRCQALVFTEADMLKRLEVK